MESQFLTFFKKKFSLKLPKERTLKPQSLTIFFATLIFNLHLGLATGRTIKFCFSVSIKEMKTFIQNNSCKLPSSALKDLFNQVDVDNRKELHFEEFYDFYDKLIFDNKVD